MRSNLFWLNDDHSADRAASADRRSRGRAGDDRRVISGIVHVLKSGCRWCGCPPEYGPPTMVHNRFVRRSPSSSSVCR